MSKASCTLSVECRIFYNFWIIDESQLFSILMETMETQWFCSHNGIVEHFFNKRQTTVTFFERNFDKVNWVEFGWKILKWQQDKEFYWKRNINENNNTHHSKWSRRHRTSNEMLTKNYSMINIRFNSLISSKPEKKMQKQKQTRKISLKEKKKDENSKS